MQFYGPLPFAFHVAEPLPWPMPGPTQAVREAVVRLEKTVAGGRSLMLSRRFLTALEVLLSRAGEEPAALGFVPPPTSADARLVVHRSVLEILSELAGEIAQVRHAVNATGRHSRLATLEAARDLMDQVGEVISGLPEMLAEARRWIDRLPAGSSVRAELEALRANHGLLEALIRDWRDARTGAHYHVTHA